MPQGMSQWADASSVGKKLLRAAKALRRSMGGTSFCLRAFTRLRDRIYYSPPMNRKTRRRLLRLARLVPGGYVIVAFLTARRVTVRGWSMATTLMPGERVLFD